MVSVETASAAQSLLKCIDVTSCKSETAFSAVEARQSGARVLDLREQEISDLPSGAHLGTALCTNVCLQALLWSLPVIPGDVRYLHQNSSATQSLKLPSGNAGNKATAGGTARTFARVCAGIRKTSVRTLDVSGNLLTAIDASLLLRSLEELKASGNNIRRLPAELSRLPNLQCISAGSNRLTDVDAAFACPQLVLASFCYNRLSSIEVLTTTVCSFCSTLHLQHAPAS
jgi:Leucine rich repeat